MRKIVTLSRALENMGLEREKIAVGALTRGLDLLSYSRKVLGLFFPWMIEKLRGAATSANLGSEARESIHVLLLPDEDTTFDYVRVMGKIGDGEWEIISESNLPNFGELGEKIFRRTTSIFNVYFEDSDPGHSEGGAMNKRNISYNVVIPSGSGRKISGQEILKEIPRIYSQFLADISHESTHVHQQLLAHSFEIESESRRHTHKENRKHISEVETGKRYEGSLLDREWLQTHDPIALSRGFKTNTVLQKDEDGVSSLSDLMKSYFGQKNKTSTPGPESDFTTLTSWDEGSRNLLIEKINHIFPESEKIQSSVLIEADDLIKDKGSISHRELDQIFRKHEEDYKDIIHTNRALSFSEMTGSNNSEKKLSEEEEDAKFIAYWMQQQEVEAFVRDMRIKLSSESKRSNKIKKNFANEFYNQIGVYLKKDEDRRRLWDKYSQTYLALGYPAKDLGTYAEAVR